MSGIHFGLIKLSIRKYVCVVCCNTKTYLVRKMALKDYFSILVMFLPVYLLSTIPFTLQKNSPFVSLGPAYKTLHSDEDKPPTIDSQSLCLH